MRSEWQRQVSPEDDLRARWGRAAWAIAGQREPERWSWPRALANFALFCALLIALTLLGAGEPAGAVGGAIAWAWAIATAHRLHLRFLAEHQGAPAPRRFTWLRIAVLICGAVAFGAVIAATAQQSRDREQVLARALGAEEVDEADERRIQRFFTTLQAFSAQHQEAIVALDDPGSSVRDHRTAVDRVSRTAGELRPIVDAISEPHVKEALSGYLRRVQNVALAMDNWVEIEEYGDADERAFDVAAAEFETASRSLAKADDALRRRLAAELTPEEREEMEAYYDRRLEEWEQATGG